METDEELFASLVGGQAVIDWFGYCPDFHDGTLERLELFDGNAVLSVRTHRMTNEIDADGYGVLDRHALVILRVRGVSGVTLEGDAAGSILFDLLIRRPEEGTPGAEWQSFIGPVGRDIEIILGASAGLSGSIVAKELEFELEPGLGPPSAG